MKRVPTLDRHEQELAEIKALADELDRSVREGLAQLEHIDEARDEGARRAGSTSTGNGAEPLLAFVHIPKTAGGTVTSMLTAAYSRPAVKDAGNYVRAPEKAPRKITSSLRRGGRVSAGHIPYGVFRENLPPETRFMTFLREPVDRVLSHYYRHIHRPRLRVAQRTARRRKGKATATSLEEALVQQRLPQLSNLCTRFLCGDPSPMEELPAIALDDAKANLREFAFVGTQDRFEASIVLLQRMLGLGLVPYLNRHLSVEGRRPTVDEISDEDYELIEQYNRLDAELYGYGLELFEDAVAAAGDGFAAEVEELRTLSKETNEEATRIAEEWLDRNALPETEIRSRELRSAAREAGVAIPALMNALSTRRLRRRGTS